MSRPVDSSPEAGLVPDQAPEAAQELAYVEDQVSVEDSSFATDGGFAASDTVGAAGNTVTVAVALALPPELVQVRE